jgi:hypothetical protein
MAGFADLVTKGVALANQLTSTLQVGVSYQAWTGISAMGDYTYAAPVTVQALVEFKQELVVDYAGNEVVSMHTVNILEPIAGNGAEGRTEPLDPRDIFTLPDGSSAKMATSETLINPVTDAGYYHVVKLGAGK